MAQDLRFTIDKETGKTVVRIIDSTTDEVIRQIPSEEVLAISKAIDRMQGLLLKQKA
jgi:flagellar protein FlaG